METIGMYVCMYACLGRQVYYRQVGSLKKTMELNPGMALLPHGGRLEPAELAKAIIQGQRHEETAHPAAEILGAKPKANPSQRAQSWVELKARRERKARVERIDKHPATSEDSLLQSRTPSPASFAHEVYGQLFSLGPRLGFFVRVPYYVGDPKTAINLETSLYRNLIEALTPLRNLKKGF